MAEKVYSTRFIAETSALTSPTFVVPAGYRAVVRSIDLYWIGGSAADTGIVLWAGLAYIFVAHATPSTEQTFQWQGRQVGNPGDTLTFFARDQPGDWGILASGYLLTLP
jgi:hypothetical protein